MIESEGLSSVVDDSLSCGLGELEGCDFKSFWNIQESIVVCDCTDNCDDGGISSSLKILCDSRERKRISIESWLIESSKDDFVEWTICSSGQEGVQLNDTEYTLMSSLR